MGDSGSWFLNCVVNRVRNVSKFELSCFEALTVVLGVVDVADPTSMILS
jgi:hypothetical protein